MPEQIENLEKIIETSQSAIENIQRDKTIAWQLGLNTVNQHRTLIERCQELIDRVSE